MTTQPLAPDWYPDPSGKPGLMYWDGERWRADIPAPPSPGKESPPPPTATSPQRPRRTALITAFVVTTIILVAVVAVLGYNLWRKSASTAPTAPLVAEAALEGLLLTPSQIDGAMGAAGMTASEVVAKMGDMSPGVSPKACLPVAFPGQSPVYAGSGFSAVRQQEAHDPEFSRELLQTVVLLPSAHDAGVFLTASAQSWPACSSRFQNRDKLVNVGPVTNESGTLSATFNYPASNGEHRCQRALTVANNVVIDVLACRVNDSTSTTGINIARQVAAKVPTK
jgi:serine/threonine-protein kinase